MYISINGKFLCITEVRLHLLSSWCSLKVEWPCKVCGSSCKAWHVRAEGLTLLREGPALAQVCETAFPPLQSTGPDHPRLLSSQGSGESTAWEVTACQVIPSFQLRHKKGNIAHVFKQIPGFEVKYRKSHIRCDIWQPFLRAGCWAVRRINDSLKPGLGCGQGLPC